MLLHQLLRRKLLSTHSPFNQPLTHQVERSLGLAEPAHAVEDPPGAKAFLCNEESMATLSKERTGWDGDVVVHDLIVFDTLKTQHMS
mmetsp:Transcript_14292/g.33625  ORF Transcript_14292/g.33625 Transcript_14292/m.33625 type:complete len:87 (-) Transcript_14292:217-477(-)